MEETTNCIVCGRDAGYHRAAIDVVEDRVVGGLCRECEREEFGRTLERGFFETRDGCVLCERDGHVAIPIWRPIARQTDDGAVVNEVTFTIDDGTMLLCDEHVATIAEEFPTNRRHPVTTR